MFFCFPGERGRRVAYGQCLAGCKDCLLYTSLPAPVHMIGLWKEEFENGQEKKHF